ncbi:MAG TPA: tetratricopeptide repeat protein [Anaerolineales bacterium]
MAKVSLRVYNREIEGMIEAGQLDEAVAHCQHILKTFPMHIETYRLLGKSFLEARRYTDAGDIFQRALMAVPDDFVAHVGMSIIRDDQGKLDDSIWHMERAFENQPSNPAIQSELRRLYGRRDGVEPPKIRLSRDALANMYSQAELFNQAIAEIRAVLADDANRADLQVMLARAYYRAGQKVEAAEMAANLLKKYTYCMDALRILVDVLPGSAYVENTQVYRQRLGMLDPYSSFVTGSVFSTDQVADPAVNLERLEYKPGAAPASPQPNWASSLGIKLADEKHVEPAPDWMTTGDSAEQFPVAASDSSGPVPAPTAGDKPIPDWMRTAGWQESSGKAQEGPVDFSAQQPAEPLAKADIPDWLKSMAPKESTEANAGTELAPANPPSPGEGDAPDWLVGLGTAAADANPESSQPAASSQDNYVFPDWLKEMGDSASAGTAAAFAADAFEPPQTEETPASTQPAPPRPATQELVKPPVPTPRLDDDTPIQPTIESKPLKIQDDAMAWLESLAAKHGVKEEELLTRPEERSEEMPVWLRSADEQPASPTTPEPSPAPSENVPLEPFSPHAGELAATEPLSSEKLPPFTSTAESTAQPPNIEDDTKAWLEGLAAEESAKPEELLPNPVERSEPPPEWIQKTTQEPAAPDEVLIPKTPQATPEEDISITSWLSKLEVEEALGKSQPAPEVLQPAAAPSNELPDWLKELEKPVTPEETPKPAENLPDWLRQPAQPADQEAAVVPTPAITSEPEMPAWIDETILVSEPPAQPADQGATAVLTPEIASEPEMPAGIGETIPVSEPSAQYADQGAVAISAPENVSESEMPAGTDETILVSEPPAQPADQGAAVVPTPPLASEPEMPAWIDETIPVSEPPAPTTPGEWVPMDEKPAPSPDLEPIAEPASLAVETPAQPQVPIGAGMLSRVPIEDKDAGFLAAAQAALDANQLNEAMQTYARLIKRNRLLDEVIHDLREAIYRFPVDIIVWQTLGDASMRANRLQDALDAYTKAEELLR